IANLNGFGIRDGHRRERPPGINFDYSQVGFKIGANQPSAVIARIAMKSYFDPAGVLDHVIIRDDVAVLIDDEARAGGFRRARFVRTIKVASASRSAIAEELPEKILRTLTLALTFRRRYMKARLFAVAACRLLRNLHSDVHNTGFELLCQ